MPGQDGDIILKMGGKLQRAGAAHGANSDLEEILPAHTGSVEDNFQPPRLAR